MRKNHEFSKGQALIMAMIFLLVLTFLGFGLVILATVDSNSSKNLRLAEQVLNAAEKGVMYGMAYAGDRTMNFHLKGQGEYVDLKSSDFTNPAYDARNPFQFQVRVIMGDQCPTPPGNAISGKSVVYRCITAESTGYVHERGRSGVDFDFTHLPAISRQVRVTGRIFFETTPN